ncbi:MAG: hypothetical protein R3Y58_03890 [Eubacteriales bacterium]
MSRLMLSNYKKGYPIKKAILCIVWLTVFVAVVSGIVEIILNTYDKDDIIGVIVCGTLNIITFFPIKKYILKKNQCFPYLNKVFSSSQLEQLLENEQFEYIEDFKGTILYKKIRESEYWLSVYGFYIYKPFVILCTLNHYRDIMSSRGSTYLQVMYLTGDSVEVDTDLNHLGECRDLFYSYARNHLDWVVIFHAINNRNYDKKFKKVLGKEKRDLFELIQDCSEIKECCKATLANRDLERYKSI